MYDKVFIHSLLRNSDSLVLVHHGIEGQKWGQRNGPPYPLRGGSYSESEKIKISAKRKKKNSIYNKKHYDEVLDADKTTLTTLSHDPDRTQDTDMFFATHKALDKHQYNALFNKPIPKTIYDENGEEISTDQFLKFRINNKLKSDVKVASEDSSAEIFRQLYKNDRDFYNYVIDETRMQKYFDDSIRYKFKGYREAEKVLTKMKDSEYTPTSNDLQTVYRLFNYTIPYDGAGDARGGKDAATQRAKFFKACKDAGYGAILDTNDAIYGGFKATSPVIVFDMEQVIPDSVKQTTMSEKKVSELVTAGRKVLGI